MKLGKILLVFILVLVIGFFAIGVVVPHYEYQNSIMVKASPHKCWDTFHTVALMNQWMDDFESLTLKSGEPLTPGSTYEIVINTDNERMIMQEQLLRIEAPVSVTFLLTNDVLTSEYTFSFKGKDATTIESYYKITGSNLIWKSILFLSKSYMVQQGQAQLDGLKKVIESQQ